MPDQSKINTKQKNSSDDRRSRPHDNGDYESVIVELRVTGNFTQSEIFSYAKRLEETGFQVDTDYQPIPMPRNVDDSSANKAIASSETIAVLRGRIQPGLIERLKSDSLVIDVWRDTPIEPFEEEEEEEEEEEVSPIDCDPNKARGDVNDVAKQLGIAPIWEAGIRGMGVTIGIVDGGVDLQEFAGDFKTQQISGGWQDDYGQKAYWGAHGNAAAAIVLAIAPEANIFDIRIAANEHPTRISSALAGFHWSISQFKANRAPQILTNGWGIYQESWDSGYASNPNHPFTRKVAEAVKEGIIVLFAAGNCGTGCPMERCAEYDVSDAGHGGSILGANGHSQVITVGAVNPKGHWIGYSSQGPATLDPKKPDICAFSHFSAYSECESGTSTACHVMAGVLALLKQNQMALTPEEAKYAIVSTANRSGEGDWGPRLGHGIIQPQKAIESLSRFDRLIEKKRQPEAVRIRADDPALIDALNRAPFAGLLADCMKDVWKQSKEDSGVERKAMDDFTGDQPGEAFILHIHGPWGAGKTSVLNFLKQRLISNKDNGLKVDTDADTWLVVDFNAWLNHRVNPPWMALLDSVYRQGFRQLLRKNPSRAVRLFFREHFWRFRYGIAPYLFAGALILWLIAFAAGLFTQDGGPAFGIHLNLIKIATNVKTILEPAALALAIFGVLSTAFRSALNNPTGITRGFLRTGRDPMRTIITHFNAITTIMKFPVAILIDDLDRCEGDYVIELLRGIQTIFHRSNVTYVVAADREWLRSSYEQKYGPYKEAIGDPGRPLGYLFLDKLFQVSVPLPRISSEKQETYLDSLIELKGCKKPEEIEKAERKARQQAEAELGGPYKEPDIFKKINEERDPLVKRALRGVAAARSISPEAGKYNEHVLKDYVHLLEPNPRSLKRLVNAYGFERAINWLSERDVDQGPLARWTILKMRWPALADYLEKFPDKIGEVGYPNDFDDSDSNMAKILNDNNVKSVVKEELPESGVLDVESLRKILGLPNNQENVAKN
jgi:hypothetical protein